MCSVGEAERECGCECESGSRGQESASYNPSRSERSSLISAVLDVEVEIEERRRLGSERGGEGRALISSQSSSVLWISSGSGYSYFRHAAVPDSDGEEMSTSMIEPVLDRLRDMGRGELGEEDDDDDDDNDDDVERPRRRFCPRVRIRSLGERRFFSTRVLGRRLLLDSGG